MPMLAIGMSVAHELIEDASDFLGNRMRPSENNTPTLVLNSRGIKVPVKVYDAFVNSENPIDLLLDTLCLIKENAQCMRLLNTLSEIMIDLCDKDFRSLPTITQKDDFSELLLITPEFMAISSVFNLRFRQLQAYPSILRTLLRKRYTKLTIDIIIVHGVPSPLQFSEHILPTLVRLGDYSSLNTYILHSELTSPTHREEVCAHIQKCLLSQLKIMMENVDQFVHYKFAFDAIKLLHAQLVAFLGKNDYKNYHSTICFVNLLDTSMWMVTQAQEGALGFTSMQIEQQNLCLASLFVKHLSYLSEDDTRLYTRLIVQRLCSKSVSFDFGLHMASLFKIQQFGGQCPKLTTTHAPALHPTLPFYSHNGYVQRVNDEHALDAMEILFYQRRINDESIAVGLNVESCLTFDGLEHSPTLLLLSIDEICSPTTGRTCLDLFISAKAGKKSRITFAVDIVSLDCCKMLERLFKDDSIVKLGYNFKRVRSIIYFC